MATLTQEYLISIIDYAPLIGSFHWRYCVNKSNLWNAKYAGELAGTVFESKPGSFYIRIKIKGITYQAHRLAWLYMTGLWPEDQIDHRDGKGYNNKWINLREANNSQNQYNAKGPAIDLVGKRYRAKITINRVQIHLGMYDTYKEAVEAYKAVSIEYHGQYSKYNRPEYVSSQAP